MNMNWNWTHRQRDLLSDRASGAESRLSAIKKAGKTFKKSVEDSLKTAPKTKQDIETRKRRTTSWELGENLAGAVQALGQDRNPLNQSQPPVSPLCLILERLANLEKTIGHMQAHNEEEINTFLSGDTPLSKLLSEEIPAINTAKKDLEQLTKKQANCQGNLDKEQKKLDKLSNEEEIDPENERQQREKRDKLSHELDSLTKDVSMEQDKLCSSLLTLISRENRYAKSVLDLMRIKKQFYEDAFKTISAELPNIERILTETTSRPVFGERLEDHLKATKRTIAFPIALAVRCLLKTGLNEEGLFRISPKQVKLDKLKAHIDSNQPLDDLLQDGDCHLYASLLKCYLRELPFPLLVGEGDAYDLWVAVAAEEDVAIRIKMIQSILDELPPMVLKNVQYVIKFLHELSYNSQTTKMIPKNISIVLGPTLLWPRDGFRVEQGGNIESIISVVVTLIEEYDHIFPEDISFELEEEERMSLQLNRVTVSSSPSPSTPTDGSARPLSFHTSGLSPPQSPPNTLSVESPSPSHRRKASIRSMGRNFMAKINPANPSSTSVSSSVHKQNAEEEFVK